MLPKTLIQSICLTNMLLMVIKFMVSFSTSTSIFTFHFLLLLFPYIRRLLYYPLPFLHLPVLPSLTNSSSSYSFQLLIHPPPSPPPSPSTSPTLLPRLSYLFSNSFVTLSQYLIIMERFNIEIAGSAPA